MTGRAGHGGEIHTGRGLEDSRMTMASGRAATCKRQVDNGIKEEIRRQVRVTGGSERGLVEWSARHTTHLAKCGEESPRPPLDPGAYFLM